MKTTALAAVGPFKIIATAEGGATATTGDVLFSVICGSETISNYNESASLLFARTGVKGSYTAVAAETLANFFVTDKPPCPTTHYAIYADAAMAEGVPRN